VLISMEMHSILNGLLRAAYAVGRRRINELIIRGLAETRHEIETGQKVTQENRARIHVRLDEIDFVPC
jgi:hypothetical protein